MNHRLAWEEEFVVVDRIPQPGGKIVRYLVFSITGRKIWVDVNEIGTMLVFEEHSFSQAIISDEERVALKSGAIECVKKHREIMERNIGFHRMARRCNECLLSRNKIVSDARRDEIIEDCVATQKHFVCHKASMQGKDVACRGFCDEHPGNTLPMRLAEAWGLNVDVEESELPNVAGNGGAVRDEFDE